MFRKKEVYGVIGNPVKQSKSPKLFNYVFKRDNINAVYKRFHFKKVDLDFMIKKNIKGLSVTTPFKRDAVKYLDVDCSVGGSINTITNKDGCLIGSNTDIVIRKLIEKKLPSAKNYIILGYGAVAKALEKEFERYERSGLPKNPFGIKKSDNKLAFIIDDSREDEDNDKLYYASHIHLDKIDWHVIINATPLGSYSKINESLLRLPESKDRNKLVCDYVYNPHETKLIRDAKTKGFKTINGLEIFLAQANNQYYEWFHKEMFDEIEETQKKGRYKELYDFLSYMQ